MAHKSSHFHKFDGRFLWCMPLQTLSLNLNLFGQRSDLAILQCIYVENLILINPLTAVELYIDGLDFSERLRDDYI